MRKASRRAFASASAEASPRGGGSPAAGAAACGPAVAGVRVTARSVPPDDTFRLDCLPPGVFEVTGKAAGYRTLAPTELRVEADATTRFDAELRPRVHRMNAPAVAYVSMSEHRKMHVMKMGNDFLQLEGRVWEKSF